MIDPRPIMTSAEFEEASAYVDDHWWATGESLIHVQSVMNIEGWRSYGHSGHMLLTPAQRTLMMWSDIVGQVQNGGFTQFCDNYGRNLVEAVAAVRALRWPELRDRFERAMAEQAGDAERPCRLQPVPLTEDAEKWRVSRSRFIRHIARKLKPWWQPITNRDLALVDAGHEEWELEWQYAAAVSTGELASGGERFLDFIEPPTDEAESFNNWFYAKETKAASAVFVQAFIAERREQLYRSI